MEITFLGHSAFRLRGRDVTAVTDPFPPASNFAMGKVVADIVTVSHNSPNHAFISGVGNEPRVVNGPGEYEIADVLIHGVATSIQPKNGALNTAYVFRFDDLTVCHLGDVREKLNDQQVEDIGSIDVLLVPVGGGRALTPTRAAEVVHQLGPQVVIPMHYRLTGGPVPELDPVDSFCREMGSKEWSAEPKAAFTRNSLPAEPRLVVLENRRI